LSSPTPVTPIDAEPGEITDRLSGPVVTPPQDLIDRIAESGAVVLTDEVSRAAAGRDWWPLAIGWAVEGAVPQRPAVVVRPSTTAQVSAVLAACNEAIVPVTPVAGRSGVCGGSIPVFGGVALDLTSLDGLVRVDETSLIADVRTGTFGPDLEAALGQVGAGYTLGHWPQSMDLSTVVGGSPVAAPANTRRATARSRTWCSASKSCWLTAGSSTPRGTVPAPPRVPT